ncbi:MAG: DoxX family protein [Bacteroidota bacterium]
MSTYQIIGLTYAAIGVLALVVIPFEGTKKKTWELDRLFASNFITWVIRLLVGGLFIYSGFIKANDYTGFAYKLEEYFTVFGTEFFVPLAFPLAWFIAVFEIALGVALILGYRFQLVLSLTTAMMIFFTFLTGYSHFTGAVTDCGCFGDALKIEPWESFTKDIILTLMLIPLWFVRKSVKALPNEPVAGAVTLATFILFGAFAYYCRTHLPMIDYRAYKVGVDLRDCTTQYGPDGLPPCKDWDVGFLDEPEFDVFQGSTLMLVAYDLDHAPDKALEASSKLVQDLSGTSVQPVAFTASGSSTIKENKEAFSLSYPFAIMDQTVLKTIIRSNPGYVLTRDGTILGKWHYNDTPSAEEVQSLLK